MKLQDYVLHMQMRLTAFETSTERNMARLSSLPRLCYHMCLLLKQTLFHVHFSRSECEVSGFVFETLKECLDTILRGRYGFGVFWEAGFSLLF